jgi:FixJ family two-component response regulator
MSEPAALTVHIVDDDPAIRDSVSLLLSLRGYRTASFADAEGFLAAVTPDWAGCILADIRMPGMSGLEMQRELLARAIPLPVIVVTAHGDVGSARAAFKSEAVDFLEKPFEEDALLAAIGHAFEKERRRITSSQALGRRHEGLAQLTPREREVMDLIVQGQHNRDIGRQLGISVRTVEVHKARLMDKLGARNLAELIRISRDTP